MFLKQDLPKITDKDVQAVDFFHDFIAFLNRLKERPIKRTVTGNLSLKDLESFLPNLKTAKDRIKDYRDHGWRLHSEQDLKALTQFKVIAEIMHLIYKRKKAFFISKSGKAFLKNLSNVQQYEQMVLYYWYRVNWDHFTPSQEINGVSLTEQLQGKQDYFWKMFSQKGSVWIDYDVFCKSTRDYFQLQAYFQDAYLGPDYELFSDIDHILFRNNLSMFSFVEIEKTSGREEWRQKISKFCPTLLGLHMFQKALNENYL